MMRALLDESKPRKEFQSTLALTQSIPPVAYQKFYKQLHTASKPITLQKGHMDHPFHENTYLLEAWRV